MNKGISVIKIVLLILAVVLVIGLGFIYATRPEEPAFDSVAAQVKDLTELVSVTGTVKPVEKVDLSFEVTGRIDEVYADVGERVKVGDEIVSLVNTDLLSELSSAQSDLNNEISRLRQLEAALDVEEAALSELKRGSRQEDIQVAQTKLDNAVKAEADALVDLNNTRNKAARDLQNLYDSAADNLNDVYIAIGDALNVKTDDMFSDTFATKGELVFDVTDPAIEADAREKRNQSLNLLEDLDQTLQTLPSSGAQLENILSETKNDISIVQDFLFTLTQALAAEINLSDSDKATFQTSVAAARDSVSMTRSALSQRIQSIEAQKVANTKSIDAAQAAHNQAKNAVILAQDELTLKKAGALPEEIASQEARVEQANANIQAQRSRISSVRSQLDIINSRIEKTVLKSPIDGIIVEQNAKVGEVTTFQEDFSSAVVSIISDKQFEIEANIPEVDIAKVSVGDHADVTLDAYGSGVIFSASVSKVDPAETIIEGVPTYKVTLNFDSEDERIKSGMTANTEIVTEQVADAVAVPLRAVVMSNGQRFVRVVVNGSFAEVPVITGLTSWEGEIEIKEGISAGDQVVTFIE